MPSLLAWTPLTPLQQVSWDLLIHFPSTSQTDPFNETSNNGILTLHGVKDSVSSADRQASLLLFPNPTLLEQPQLPEFPVAHVVHCHTLRDSTQHQCIILQLRRSRVWKGLRKLKSRCWQMFFLEVLCENSFLCLFQSQEAAHTPRLVVDHDICYWRKTHFIFCKSPGEWM